MLFAIISTYMSHRDFVGARREGRTPTLVKEPDFESGASASSAIRAIMRVHSKPVETISTMNPRTGQTT